MVLRYFKYALIILILVSLTVFISFTDFQAVRVQLALVGWNFLWILLISSGSLFFGSLAWKYSFDDPTKISHYKLFYIRTVGEMVTLVNPTNLVAGEASKVMLLNGSDLSKREKLDSIFVSRAILVGTQIILSVICFAWLSSGVGLLHWYVLICFGVVLIFWLGNKILHRYIFENPSFDNIVSIRRLQYFRLFVKKFSHRFRLFRINKKRQVYKILLLSVLHWFVGAVELIFILFLVHEQIGFLQALSMDMGVVLLKSVGGFVPAQIGIEEFGNKWMLSLIGVSAPAIWISVSIIRRARMLFWLGLSLVAFSIQKLISKKTNNGHIIYNA